MTTPPCSAVEGEEGRGKRVAVARSLRRDAACRGALLCDSQRRTVATSQSFTAASSLAVASQSPSDDQAQSDSPPVWPRSTASTAPPAALLLVLLLLLPPPPPAPLPTAASAAVASADADATSKPSGEKRTDATGPP